MEINSDTIAKIETFIKQTESVLKPFEAMLIEFGPLLPRSLSEPVASAVKVLTLFQEMAPKLLTDLEMVVKDVEAAFAGIAGAGVVAVAAKPVIDKAAD